MVDQTTEFVSRKYATACLNVFASKFKPEDVDNLIKMSEYLRHNHSAVYFLGLPVITFDKKMQFMLALSRRFSLEHLIARLVALLLQDKRLFLLADILKIMSNLYRTQMNILAFTITSYPRVSPSDLGEIKEFLAQRTGCAIIYTDHEDKKLIAGIRMESSTYLWEYSIAQQLRNVAKLTMR